MVRSRSWGPDPDRLHRWLLQRPWLLPRGAPLLLAVSGGQDSMALTALLRDLQPLHGWRLVLWHGDHGWHPQSGHQAAALLAWAAAEGLEACSDRAAPAEAAGEAAARQWRLTCLARQAPRHGCQHIVTGHTATDRAETVLLNLARGCHRRGLASLGPSRPLSEIEGAAPSLRLVRPLLLFDRQDTARLCRQRQLPVWLDPSNSDRRLRRNRLRADVLPVLEELHPGAIRRISLQASRLAQELERDRELLDLALIGLERREGTVCGLDRRALARLTDATRSLVLHAWLQRDANLQAQAVVLDSLGCRLGHPTSTGRQDLPGGWAVRWSASLLVLSSPGEPDAGSGSHQSL